MKDKIAVIIPTYNEVEHILSVIRQVKKHIKNIIVVDDGSSDGTSDLLLKEKFILIKHLVNLGKGAALKTGVEYARDKGFKKVLFMDSDRQHDPSDLTKFLKSLRKYDLVLGVRKLYFRKTGLRFLGNKINSWLIKKLFGKTVCDPLCGFRGFNLKIYPKIKWDSTGYGVETEIIVRAIRNEINLKEIPISSIYLDKYKGVSILDAYQTFFDMIKWKLSL